MSKEEGIDNAKSPEQEGPWEGTESGSVDLGRKCNKENGKRTPTRSQAEHLIHLTVNSHNNSLG